VFRLPASLSVLLLAAAPGLAELTQSERDRALSHLHASREAFLDAVGGLSEAEWNFKPVAAAWSISEVAEHIALSEDAIFRRIVENILKSPALPARKDGILERDEQIIKRIADRSEKAQAPSFLVPAKPGDPAAFVKQFKESRARTLAYVRSTREDLRSHFAPHPAVGDLDGYQWFLLLAAHTERHTAQIAEVKAHSGYPQPRR
jgi:uncharacterized damage-inducible protein DinB